MAHIGLPLRGRPILLSLACLFTDRIGSSVSSITVTNVTCLFSCLTACPAWLRHLYKRRGKFCTCAEEQYKRRQIFCHFGLKQEP